MKVLWTYERYDDGTESWDAVVHGVKINLHKTSESSLIKWTIGDDLMIRYVDNVDAAMEQSVRVAKEYRQGESRA